MTLCLLQSGRGAVLLALCFSTIYYATRLSLSSPLLIFSEKPRTDLSSSQLESTIIFWRAFAFLFLIALPSSSPVPLLCPFPVATHMGFSFSFSSPAAAWWTCFIVAEILSRSYFNQVGPNICCPVPSWPIPSHLFSSHQPAQPRASMLHTVADIHRQQSTVASDAMTFTAVQSLTGLWLMA